MKILFITPSVPNRLNRIRVFQLIKYLSIDHKLHLLSLIPPNQEKADVDELKKYCESITLIKQPLAQSLLWGLLLLLSPIPLEVAFCRNSWMNKKVKRLVEKYSPDIIFVKRLRSAQYIDPCLKVPSILDTTDAMSYYYKNALKTVPIYKKVLYFEEWLKYRNYENRISKRFKTWIVSSDHDKKYLDVALSGDVSIHTVPNGVDLSYYDKTFSKPEQRTILFSGLMNKHVNISATLFFVHKIFPKIQAKYRSTRLYIVGPSPVKEIRKLHSGKEIIVTGYVADIREYISKAMVVVCPVLTGTGTRNKILQAWAMRRPVVSTSIGASGLKYTAGKNIIIADEPKTFADKVMSLFENNSLWHKLSHGGRISVDKNYSMSKITIDFSKLLGEIITSEQK